MVLPVVVGVVLVFIGRVAYHHLLIRLHARGKIATSETDHPGAFLATVGVAVALWFALDALLGWNLPFLWRIAAIGFGFLLADGAVSGLRRR